MNKKNIHSFVFVFVFMGLLLSPLLDNVLGVDKTIHNENRGLAKMPIFSIDSLETFPMKFNTFISDNFGFRKLFVQLNGKYKYKFFNSETKRRVLFGKNNWLFLGYDASNDKEFIFSDFTHRNLRTKEELRDIGNKYKFLTKKFDKANIEYYKACFPNKHSVYKSNLPERAKICVLDTLSRLDQLIGYLGKDQQNIVDIIDLREEFISKNNQQSLYIKGDTHWNEFGAYLAYQRILKEIAKDFPQVKPHNLDDYEVRWYNSLSAWEKDKLDWCEDCYNDYPVGYDSKLYCPQGLFKQLGFSNTSFLDSIPIFRLKNQLNLPKKTFESNEAGPKKVVIYENKDSNDDLTVLYFRDSFGECLMKFLSVHFKKIVFVKGKINMQTVKKYQPDIIIDGHVERYFR